MISQIYGMDDEWKADDKICFKCWKDLIALPSTLYKFTHNCIDHRKLYREKINHNLDKLYLKTPSLPFSY